MAEGAQWPRFCEPPQGQEGTLASHADSSPSQVAHPLVQQQLVDYVHNGFLVPVMGPALHKVGARAGQGRWGRKRSLALWLGCGRPQFPHGEGAWAGFLMGVCTRVHGRERRVWAHT